MDKVKNINSDFLYELFKNRYISKQAVMNFCDYSGLTMNKNMKNDCITFDHDNKISVIIPTYNRSKMLIETLDSIKNQKYKNVEIIIVNDNSADNTTEMVNEYIKNNPVLNIIYIINEVGKGAGLTRKTGYLKATGEYVIFCDDDDLYIDNDFFNKSVDVLNKNKNISFVSSNSFIKIESDNSYTFKKMNIENEINNTEYINNFQTKYMKSNSSFTSVFRKSDLDDIGFKELDMMNDSTIYLKALLCGNAYVIKDIIGIYRIHNNNLSFNLTSDFIIENLIEKKNLYMEIKDNEFVNDDWFNNQVELTVKYYLKSPNVSDEDYKKIYDWCKLNVSDEEIIKKLIKC